MLFSLFIRGAGTVGQLDRRQRRADLRGRRARRQPEVPQQRREDLTLALARCSRADRQGRSFLRFPYL